MKSGVAGNKLYMTYKRVAYPILLDTEGSTINFVSENSLQLQMCWIKKLKVKKLRQRIKKGGKKKGPSEFGD